MKIFWGFVFFCLPVCADQRQETFLRANAHYAAGQCQQAADLYQSLANKSGTIWYNLGNCLYRTGKHAQAMSCWLRAVSDVPREWQRATWTNIALAQKQHAIPAAAWWKSSLREIAWLPLGLLQLCSLLSLALFALSMLMRWRRSFCLLALMGTSCALVATTCAYRERGRCQTVVLDNTHLRAGPSDDYGAVGAVPACTIADVIDTHDNWQCVRTTCGATGWVAAQALCL